MACVYILRGSSGRHYIGSTENFERRLAEHRRGNNYTTRRLGHPIEVIGTRKFCAMAEARAFERQLKRWKNIGFAIAQLRSAKSSPE